MSTDTLDPRLLRVSVEVNGRIKQYTDIAITVSGTKYANSAQNECEVKLTNLDKATRDYLLTVTSPFNRNRTRKQLRVEAGRVSTGYTLVYQGDIVSAVGAQPPDIALTLRAATCDFFKGDIVARSMPGVAPMSNIAGRISQDLGLSLNFQAQQKQIANFSHSGASLKQVDRLGDMGRVNAFVDDGALIVKDWNIPLTGPVREVNLDTGMIGIPEFTQFGVQVKMLFDTRTKLGGGLRIKSKLNPAANGLYAISKLGFELANRDTPFYWIAEAVRASGA